MISSAGMHDDDPGPTISVIAWMLSIVGTAVFSVLLHVVCPGFANLRNSSTKMVSIMAMLKPNDAKVGTPGHLDTIRQLVRLRGSTEVLVHWEGSFLTISITEVNLKHRQL